MSTDPNTVRLLARFPYPTLTNRLRELFSDLRARLWGGRRLSSRQRDFLLRDFRLELETAVEDAERHAIPDDDADRIAHVRSLIRWLGHGDPPGPEVIPYLERQLGGIPRRAHPHDLVERKALIAAIYELGGNGRAAAGIYEKGDPDLLRAFGWTLHRLMRRTGLTVADLAERSDLEPSEVVAYLYGVEQPRLGEIVVLAGAVGVKASLLIEGALSGAAGRPGREAGLNADRPGHDDTDARP